MSSWHNFMTLARLATPVSRLGANGYMGLSVEITQVCPMECPDCYVPVIKSGPHGLPIEGWVKIISDAVKAGAVHLTIVGGEPGARRKELHHVVGITPITWIITTFFYEMGTFVKNGRQSPVTYVVSIDGPDEMHNRLRGVPGLADRARRQILLGREKASALGHVFAVFSHTVLMSANAGEMERLIWQLDGFPGIDGMVFSTATPPIGESLPEWAPTDAQRADFVELLLKLRQMGARINMSEAQIGTLHPDHTATYSPAMCAIANRVISYDFHGKPKGQCIFGPEADCSHCGCVVNSLIDPFHQIAASRLPLAGKFIQALTLPDGTLESVASMIV